MSPPLYRLQWTSLHSGPVRLVQMLPLIGVLPCCPPAEFSVKPVALKETGFAWWKQYWRAQMCGTWECLLCQHGCFSNTNNTGGQIWLLLLTLLARSLPELPEFPELPELRYPLHDHGANHPKRYYRPKRKAEDTGQILSVLCLQFSWACNGDFWATMLAMLSCTCILVSLCTKLLLVTESWLRNILRLYERIELCDIRGIQERSDNSRTDHDLILKSVLYKDWKEG